METKDKSITTSEFLLQSIKAAWQTTFYDKDGKLVIAQFPNIPLSIWILTRIAEWAALCPNQSDNLSRVGTSFLLVWAYLEAALGVNLFRRRLGVIVLTMIVVGMFR